MPQRIVQVDAFTSEPFTGNPAAVCVLEKPRDEKWMQNVALEMNLSETAFVVKHPSDDEWLLRWYTPAAEVDLCGHATLATAHVLFEEGHVSQDDAIRFSTRSGRLSVRSSGGWLEMDFPAEPAEKAAAPDGLLAALGIEAGVPTFVGRNRLDWIVAIESPAALRALSPDMVRLAGIDTRGVMVTSPSDESRFDFLSRFFVPALGIPEDPVTGSAHCCLAPFWADRIGRNELVGYQASPRGGIVRVRNEVTRVMLTGQAVTVLRGELVD